MKKTLLPTLVVIVASIFAASCQSFVTLLGKSEKTLQDASSRGEW
jgi:hypothetical protein